MGALAHAAPRKEMNRSSAVRETEPRRLEGKHFVPLEDSFNQAIREGCDSLTELKLILFIMQLANEREAGNPFGLTRPVMKKELAAAAGCSKQNINCASNVLFGETSIIEEVRVKGAKPGNKRISEADSDSDSRSFPYRIRVEYLSKWLKLRRASHERASEDARQAAEDRRKIAAEEDVAEKRRVRRYSLRKPVRLGPGAKPFPLPDEAQDAIQEATSISSVLPGELRRFTVNARGVLIFDFHPEGSGEIDKSTCRSAASPPADSIPKIDKSTCRSPKPTVENKGLNRASFEPRTAELSAGLAARGLAQRADLWAAILAALPDVPLSFFFKTLDAKRQKAARLHREYDPAWLPTAAADAFEEWQRLNKQFDQTPAPPAPVCSKCAGSGFVGGLKWKVIGEVMAHVAAGARFCECLDGITTREFADAFHPSGRRKKS